MKRLLLKFFLILSHVCYKKVHKKSFITHHDDHSKLLLDIHFFNIFRKELFFYCFCIRKVCHFLQRDIKKFVNFEIVSMGFFSLVFHVIHRTKEKREKCGNFVEVLACILINKNQNLCFVGFETTRQSVHN